MTGAAERPPSRAWWLVRIGAGMGLGFGLFMGLFALLLSLASDASGPRRLVVALLVLVVSGVLFGGTMAALLGVVDARQRRRHGIPFSPRVRHGAQTVVPVPIHAVGQRAWEVLRHAGSAPHWDPAGGELVVTTGASWWSWGERVAVRLHDVSTPHGPATAVEVTSRPRLRTQLADYGTNQRRVRDVIVALTPPR